MPIGRPGTFVRAGAIALLFMGCTGQGSASPTPAAIATTPEVTPAAPTSAATIAVIPTATPAPTFPPDLESLPTGFIEGFSKREEGAHGGSPAVDLPSSVAVDYWVSGTCDFDISVRPDRQNVTLPVATFSMRMLGTVVSGTWLVTVIPGSYDINPGEAVGCTFSITVRAAGE